MSEDKKGFWSPENLRSMALLVFFILCFRWSVASPYHVPTASMEPTIKVGDRLLAFKLSYDLKIPFTDYKVASWGSPQRGDIIVFKYPKDPDIDYVKRVIGLPGDKIKVVNDILYINGEAQPRTDHNQDRTILDDIDDRKEVKLLYREQLGPVNHWVMQNEAFARPLQNSDWPAEGEYIVPADSLFAMGDNRDNSTDSRIWGPVPMSYVRGKALFVIWSLNPRTTSFLPEIRFNRFGFGLQ